MCEHCGCTAATRSIALHERLLADNDSHARHNRVHLARNGVLAVNLMSAPGAGKTALIEASIERLAPRLSIAVIAGDLATDNDARRVRARGVPCVQISRYVKGVGLDFAGNDHRRGTFLATEHLISLGHRRIAMIGGTDRTSTGFERHQGYLDAVKAHGLQPDPALIVRCPGTREDGAEAIGTRVIGARIMNPLPLATPRRVKKATKTRKRNLQVLFRGFVLSWLILSK